MMKLPGYILFGSLLACGSAVAETSSKGNAWWWDDAWWDERIQRHARRVAARGFVVLAPDIYKAHFIGTHPIEHDYELEKDVNAAVDVLLAREDISTDKACLYSHTRGGYYTLKVATTFKRQENDIACYVSYYPHLQDPNAPEPQQVYGYAPEIDQLVLPTPGHGSRPGTRLKPWVQR